ncbi:MOG protein, partial [Crypturellus undulatus]|nr:MOG protein [Crypturellus undulatus]
FIPPMQELSVSLLFLHVLLHVTAQLNVVGPGHLLTATVGQDVVLPCQLSPTLNAQTMTVRWIRHQVSETVHLYRDGEDLYLEQMREYRGRTKLSHDGLLRGKLDLIIASVRPSDDGLYVCTVQDDTGYGETEVELEVSAPLFQDVHPWKVALAVVLVTLLSLILGLSVYTVLLFKKK